MVVITFRKALDLVAYSLRDRRDPRRLEPNSGAARDDSAPGPDAIAGLISREPDPAFVAELAEQFEALLNKLGDDQLRDIVTWKVDVDQPYCLHRQRCPGLRFWRPSPGSSAG
jgi:hypothetical protein